MITVQDDLCCYIDHPFFAMGAYICLRAEKDKCKKKKETKNLTDGKKLQT